MNQFEYRVIPAPLRGEKAKDAKTPSDRYSLALTAELNRMAQDGWEYVRADVLPSEERSGLTGRTTVYHNLLVFRRVVAAPAASAARTPQPEYPVAASAPAAPVDIPATPPAAAPLPAGDAVPPAPRKAPDQT